MMTFYNMPETFCKYQYACIYMKIYEINNFVIQLYVTRFLREPQIGTQW